MVFFVAIQSLLITLGQVFLKFAMLRVAPFGWNGTFMRSIFLNWHLYLSGILVLSGTFMWMYMIKHFPLSFLMPMQSVSYVMGMVAAIYFFHEDVSLLKWCGMAFILLGCAMIAKF